MLEDQSSDIKQTEISSSKRKPDKVRFHYSETCMYRSPAGHNDQVVRGNTIMTFILNIGEVYIEVGHLSIRSGNKLNCILNLEAAYIACQVATAMQTLLELSVKTPALNDTQYTVVLYVGHRHEY